MSDYYSECIEKIVSLIEEDQLEEASIKIKEELSMPYIPQDVEKQLQALLKDARTLAPRKTLNDEEIEDYLMKDEYDQLIALQALSEKNLRAYVELIQKAFDAAKSDLVKISLMEICINQQLNEEFKLEKDGLEIRFIPSMCESPLESEGVHRCFAYLKEWLENEDPSFLDLCEQSAVSEAYLHLPFPIEEEEGEAMAREIVLYVARLMDCEERMKSLVCEKNTSQKGSFELLLYSNAI